MLQATTDLMPRAAIAIPKRISRVIGRVYNSKAPLYHQGDEACHIYKVNSGVVMTYRLLEDSTRQITGFATAGSFFGMTSDECHNDNAVATTTCNIAKISHAELVANPALQSQLFNSTCSQLEESQNMMMTLSKKNASEKVASFLYMIAKRQGKNEEETDIGLPMSRLDIADYIGMSIETVSRQLTSLKDKGIISLPSRHTAHIHKMGILAQSAGALA